jgi:hypothetical protein
MISNMVRVAYFYRLFRQENEEMGQLVPRIGISAKYNVLHIPLSNIGRGEFTGFSVRQIEPWRGARTYSGTEGQNQRSGIGYLKSNNGIAE